MGETKGYVHSVETLGALDGPGIRYVVFLQGCPLRCRYCHNPDTWQFCAPGARRMTAEGLLSDILNYKNYIKSGGVTLSGGEPLAQPEFVYSLLKLCGENGIHTAVDTSGAVPLRSCEKAVCAADLIILDIKSTDPEQCRELTGSDASIALELLNFCETIKKSVWIRHVVVPSLTLDGAQLERTAVLLKNYSCVKKVELLPFHKTGEYKWRDLGLDYTLGDIKEPTDEEMDAACAVFRRYGLI